VKGCCKKVNVERAVNKAFNSWITKQRKAHPRLPMIRAYHGSYVAKCVQMDDRPIGGRSCYGDTKLFCQVTFLSKFPKP
jgi:hypothetical protein